MEMDFLQKLAAIAESEGYELSGLEDQCGNCEGIRCNIRDLKVVFRHKTPMFRPNPSDQASVTASPPGQHIS
jgi:hypothetical protein